MRYDRNKIKDAFRKLSRPVQDFILSEEQLDVFKKIVSTNRLHTDQAGALSNLIAAVQVGLFRSESLQEEIRNEVAVDEETTNRIVGDINDLILKPLAEVMKHPDRFTEQTESQAKEPPQTASTQTEPELNAIRKKLQGVADAPTQKGAAPHTTPKIPTPQTLSPQSQSAPPKDDAAIVQPQTQQDTPKRYPDGVDPYREPIN